MPIAGYALFPTLASGFLEQQLEALGYENPHISIGYPGWESTTIHQLSFQKILLGERMTLSLEDTRIHYHLPKLLEGTVHQIHIPNATLEIHPSTPADPPLSQRDQSEVTGPAPDQKVLTAGELTQSLPFIPFEQLLLDHLSISRTAATDPLQETTIGGSIETKNGLLWGDFTFQGTNLSPYQLVFSGRKIGDMDLVLRSLLQTETPVVSLTSTLTPTEDRLRLRGTLDADFGKLFLFLRQVFPLESLETAFQEIAGNVTATWQGSLPKNASLASIMDEDGTTIGGSFQLNLDLPNISLFGKSLTGLSTVSRGDFTANRGAITWSLAEHTHLSAQVDMTDFPVPEHLGFLLQHEHARVTIDLPHPVKGVLSLADKDSHLTVDGTIHVRLDTTDPPLNVEVSLKHFSGWPPERITGEGNFSISGSIPRFPHPDVQVRNAKWNLAGKASLTNQAIHLVLAPSSFVEASGVKFQETTIPFARIEGKNVIRLSYQMDTKAWQVDPARLTIRAPQIDWKGQSFSNRLIRVDFDQIQGEPEVSVAQGKLYLLGFSTQVGDFTPPVTNWQFNFIAKPSTVTIDFLGQTPNNTVSTRGRVQHQFSTNQGGIRLRLSPLTISPSAFTLREVISPWPFPFDITSGKVSATARFSWVRKPGNSGQEIAIKNLGMTIVLDHLAGHWEKVIVNDLSTTITIVGVEEWLMPQPSSLTIKTVSSGVTATNINLRYQLRHNPTSPIPFAEIWDLSASLLGGTVSIKHLPWDDSQERHSFTVELQHLALGEILQLEQQKGLQGTGLLDGSLPVTWSRSGVEIHTGEVAARPPGGVVRFEASEETAQSFSETNSNLSLVLQALSNFHYDVLKVGLEYQQDGTLNLSMRLEGKNPDLKKGQPIHFNLTIEENIPALLKSLQVVQRIEEQIEQMLK